MVFVLSKIDQVYSVFLAVDGLHRSALLTVVYNDLVISTGGYNVHSIIGVADVGDLFCVFLV